MQIRSLHTQVNIVLLFLTITLLIKVFSAHYSFSTLIKNQVVLSQSHHNVGVIYELERDVIDLQRNLLIYKETGSDSSIHRFHTVIENVNDRINDLSGDVGSDDSFLVGKEIFSRMVSHIQDYEDNFTSVITAKAQQQASIELIENRIKNLENNINNNQSLSVMMQNYVFELSQNMNSYLQSLDPEEISKFNRVIHEFTNKLDAVKNENKIDTLNVIKKEFRRLIQLNRGYLYLVNVVMAGSANEFLFLTKKIRENAIIKQNEMERLADISSRNAQFVNGVVSSLFMLIILSITWFLSRRILLPIKNITDVFNVLSRGDDISVIPNTNAKNEIGNLARAAEVFHQNNRLTQKLLVESQDMIANQEVLNIQLEEEKKKAEMAAESKSMFLANMSHEIRTPMNGIVGLVDLVLKTDLTSKQRRYLDRIAYSGQIMMNVINDILDFSKIEAGKMEIESVEFDVNSVIENVISSMLVRVKDKSLDFKVWVTPIVPKILKGDPLRISQVLLNLCSNSIKFTDQGGSIAIKFDYIDNMFCFSVHDTGIGMSPQQVESIFESFTQADGSISRKYGGTGLGLTIVEQLVKLMGGVIKVESDVGVGTSVFVRISCESLNTAPVLAPLEQTSPVVHYVGRNGKPSALKYVLEDLNVTLEDLSQFRGDSNFICALPEHKLIIFEGMQALDTLTITRCIDANTKLFCILNSNESAEKEKLKELDQVEILQHPFSPKQYQIFFKRILGLKVKDSKTQVNVAKTKCVISGHVLLVEDNAINQIVAGDMLESLGVTFDLAEDGIQAVEAIKSKDYDLVFMDVQMPKMDGYTATKTVRACGIDNVIICGLSANALKEDLERAQESGMNDYLTKPLKQDSLRLMLEKYLSSTPPAVM
ncbi:ATP-binding protein [Pseudomonas sp. HK3]